MALKRINGILHVFDTSKLNIKKVSAGRWEIEADIGKFVVVGGSKSGGARNEWYIHFPLLYGDQWVKTTSMVKAIKMGLQG